MATAASATELEASSKIRMTLISNFDTRSKLRYSYFDNVKMLLMRKTLSKNCFSKVFVGQVPDCKSVTD